MSNAVWLAIGMLGAAFYLVTWRIGEATWKHHGWYGLAAMLAGLVLGWSWLWAVGAVLYLEDFVTHTIQATRPRFVGPIHWLYERTLYRWMPWLG